jgi:hypothetical protein
MSAINLHDIDQHVYVILGIDEHENDRVIAVRPTYEEAKNYCVKFLALHDFYDVWIEKHPLM